MTQFGDDLRAVLAKKKDQLSARDAIAERARAANARRRDDLEAAAEGIARDVFGPLLGDFAAALVAAGVFRTSSEVTVGRHARGAHMCHVSGSAPGAIVRVRFYAAATAEGRIALAGECLTGCQDDYFKVGEARLWNAASGQPLTPPLIHAHAVAAVAFRPDGKAVATGDAVLSIRGPGDGDISIWNLPAPMSGDVEVIRRRIQVWTGLELEDSDRFEALTPETWQEQRQKVEARGMSRGA